MDNVGAALGGTLWIALALAAVAFWIYALVDVVRTPEDAFRRGTKVIWVLVVALLEPVGALIYWFAGRPRGGARATAAR
ncbi:MAG: PLD nuclease N-terminal domain-containing protein [Actinomycetota bacterium]